MLSVLHTEFVKDTALYKKNTNMFQILTKRGAKEQIKKKKKEKKKERRAMIQMIFRENISMLMAIYNKTGGITIH